MEQNNGNVSLTISKEIVTPIVQAKIQEAILAAMGGKEEILKKVVHEVLNKKVGYDGKESNYSSDNKYSWLDAVVTAQIKEAVQVELKNVISESTVEIRKALISQLKSNKGASKVADAILSGLAQTFTSEYRSSVIVQFGKPGEK
jgi:hypothetical protein